MVNKSFDRCFENVIMIEGGYVNNPVDNGAKTKYGITEATARAHGYQGDMKDLSLGLAKVIYKKSYWDINRLDDFNSKLIQEELFDTGVNRGVRNAVKYIQRAYNVLVGEKVLDVDGLVGRQTLNAINSCLATNDLFNIMNILQGYDYIKIVENNPSQKIFLKGWIRKRLKFFKLSVD